MSPIPPVLVLSFLLLPPLAEAEEMMDPFALIRETLKYWRRIYEMYQEEVDLGYCWAEYFLRSENATKNVPMSHSVDHDWLNFELEEGRLPRVNREDRVRSADSRRERVRGKRSLEILNSVDGDGDISIVFGDGVRHSDGRPVISKVYSKNRGNSMSGFDDARQSSFLSEGRQKGANDQVSGFTVRDDSDDVKEVLLFPSRLLNTFREEMSKISVKTSRRNDQGRAENLRIYPRSAKRRQELESIWDKNGLRKDANDQMSGLTVKDVSGNIERSSALSKALQKDTNNQISGLIVKDIKDEVEKSSPLSKTLQKNTNGQFTGLTVKNVRDNVKKSLLFPSRLLNTFREEMSKTRQELESIIWNKNDLQKNANDQISSFTVKDIKDDVEKSSPLSKALQKNTNDQISSFTVKNVRDKIKRSSPSMKHTERHNEEKPNARSKSRYDLALTNDRKHMSSCRRKKNCKCTNIEVPNESSYLPPSFLNGSSLKISTKSSIKNDNKELFVQKLRTSKVYSKTAKTRRYLKSADCRYRVFRKDVDQVSDCDDVKKSSSFLAPLLNVYGEVSTVSKEGMGMLDPREVSIRKSGTLRVHSTTGCDLESMSRREHTLRRRRKKGRQFLGIYSVNGSFDPFLYELNTSRFMISKISKKNFGKDGDRSSFNQTTGHLKMYSKNFWMKNKLNSINWHKSMLYRRSMKNTQLSVIKDTTGSHNYPPSLVNKARLKTFEKNSRKSEIRRTPVQRSSSLKTYPNIKRTRYDLNSINWHNNMLQRRSKKSNQLSTIKDTIGSHNYPPSLVNKARLKTFEKNSRKSEIRRIPVQRSSSLRTYPNSKRTRYDLNSINWHNSMLHRRSKRSNQLSTIKDTIGSHNYPPYLVNKSRLKTFEKNSTKSEIRRIPVQRSSSLKTYLNIKRTRYDLNSINWHNNMLHRRSKRSNQLSVIKDTIGSHNYPPSLVNKAHLKTFEKNSRKSEIRRIPVQRSSSLKTYPNIKRTRYDLNSINYHNNMLYRRSMNNIQLSIIKDTTRSRNYPPSSPNKTRSKSPKKNSTKNNIWKLPVYQSSNLNIHPKTTKTKHDLNSLNRHKHNLHPSRDFSKNNVTTKPSSLPSSLHTFTRSSAVPPKSKQVVKAQFDPELKGSQAEGEPDGKSKGLETNAYRKLLSAYSPRRALTLKVAHPGSQKSFDVPFLSLGRVASVDSRFNWKDTTKKLDHNTDRKHPSCGKGFDSLNPGIQGAEQRPGSLDGTYRTSSRRKRDANDRIRLLQPLGESKIPSYFEPVNKTRRLLASPSYTVPKSTLWRAFNFKRNEGKNNEHGSRMRSNYPNLPSGNSSPFYLKYHKNLSRRKQVLPVTLIKLYKAPLPLVSSYGILRQSPRDVFPNPSIKDHKREYAWEKGSSKQLTTLDHDNKYRGTEFTGLLPVGESVLEETGKKEAIQDPVGRPSLLPVSYQRFMGDYGNSASGTSRNSGPSRSSRAKDQGRRFSSNLVEARGHGRMLTTLFDLRAVFMAFLRNLGFFVQVGREIIDYVESNMALACTKDYLWSKIVQWIDS